MIDFELATVDSDMSRVSLSEVHTDSAQISLGLFSIRKKHSRVDSDSITTDRRIIRSDPNGRILWKNKNIAILNRSENVQKWIEFNMRVTFKWNVWLI